MLYPLLRQTIKELQNDFGQISPDRKKVLNQLAIYIAQQLRMGKPALLNFICTHNSRRSHMAQVWAQAAAYFYRLPELYAFSGGTEATAFHPNAIQALSEAGFQIEEKQQGENPVYRVSFGKGLRPLEAFSKVFDGAGNPDTDFAAILTCSHAEENCPFIPGANLRLAIPFEDPKLADNSPQEKQVYQERSRQIGREMVYALSCVK